MTRHIIAGFVVALALCTAAPRASAQAVSEQELQRMGENLQKALDARDWKRVVRIGERVMEARPGLAVVPYNLACAHAQLGENDAALEWLQKSADNGYAGIASIETDPDLDPIREDPRFKVVHDQVQAARDKRFEVFRAAAEEADLLTILPPGYDPQVAAPLVIVLHGSGGRPEPVAEVHKKAAGEVGAIIVAPSALRPLGDGFNWTFRDEAEWMVLHTLERAAAEHTIDMDKVVVAGFSQGANMALEVGLKHPEKFAGIIATSGHWQPAIMTIPEEGKRPRVQLLIGGDDEWAWTFKEARGALSGAGVESRLEIVPGVGHAYPPNSDERLERALRFVLGE
ncbi:MAG: alpha/beta hydrolase-fold protein [Phycisphaerales bacterium]